MNKKNQILIPAIVCVFIVSACTSPLPGSTNTPAQTLSEPAVPNTVTAQTETPETILPSVSPTITQDLSLPTPTLIPTRSAGPLIIVTYQIKEFFPVESLSFTTVQGQSYADVELKNQGTRFPDRSFYEGMTYCIQNELDGASLIACVGYNQGGTQSWVTLTRDGKEIYRIDTGSGFPVSPLQGLWVYDHHWVLETVHITTHQNGNATSADLVGQISVDGDLINERLNYAEAFSFQTIDGQPFFFFKRDGKMGFSYAGTETPLNYDTIPHYGCCSGAVLNPQAWTDAVAFIGQLGETWYYAIIDVLDRP